MKKLKQYFRIGMILSGFFLFGIAHQTLAQTSDDVSDLAASKYPSHIDNHVNDFSDVISDQDEALLKEQLTNFQTDTGIQIVIATMDSIYDFETNDETIEQFARNLFNDWGVGDSKRNDGILILVTVKDRAMRIQLGMGYGREYDAAMQQVVDESFLPSFKNEQYGTGIVLGTKEVMDTVSEGVSWFSYYKWYLLGGVIILILVAAGISALRSGKKGWGFLLLSAAFGLLVWLLKTMGSGSDSNSSSSGGGFGGGKSSGGGATGRW